jgi:hypothetical protein
MISARSTGFSRQLLLDNETAAEKPPGHRVPIVGGTTSARKGGQT